MKSQLEKLTQVEKEVSSMVSAIDVNDTESEKQFNKLYGLANTIRGVINNLSNTCTPEDNSSDISVNLDVLDKMPEGATLVELTEEGNARRWLKLSSVGELYVKCIGSWDREPSNDINNLYSVESIKLILKLQR